MRGIKRKCQLVIVGLNVGENKAITTFSQVSNHDSITKAEMHLLQAGELIPIVWHKIIPSD